MSFGEKAVTLDVVPEPEKSKASKIDSNKIHMAKTQGDVVEYQAIKGLAREESDNFKATYDKLGESSHTVNVITIPNEQLNQDELILRPMSKLPETPVRKTGVILKAFEYSIHSQPLL